MDALKKGKDVELTYDWGTGAHAVDVVGAGITNGKPWIIHVSDLDQNSDSKGAGPSGLSFEWLNDPDKDGKLNLSGSNKEIV